MLGCRLYFEVNNLTIMFLCMLGYMLHDVSDFVSRRTQFDVYMFGALTNHFVYTLTLYHDVCITHVAACLRLRIKRVSHRDDGPGHGMCKGRRDHRQVHHIICYGRFCVPSICNEPI